MSSFSKSGHSLATILLVLFLALQYEVYFTEGRIFKCCDSGENLEIGGVNNGSFGGDGSVVLKNEYFIVTNQTGEEEEGDGESQNRTDTEVRDCHSNEAILSSTLSLYPNTLDKAFLTNGFLRNGEEYYSPDQYCVKESINQSVTIKIRPSSYCDEDGHCLRKCCNPLEVYDLSTYGISKLECVPSVESPWDPVIHNVKGSNGLPKSVQFKSDHLRNWCNSDNIVLFSMRGIGRERKSLFRIMNDGTVVRKDGVKWRTMNSSKICVDGAINIPGYFDPSDKQTLYSGDDMDMIMLECGPTVTKDSNESPTLLYGIGMAISTVFLLLTMIVYGLLWDKQNLHGLNLLGFVTTEFFLFLSLLAIFFYTHRYPDPNFTTEGEILSSLCGILAVISNFLYISANCWLTVISFDIFSKFRILKLTRARSKNTLKFMIYLFFTLFVPAVIVGTGVLLDLLYGDDVDVDIILPRYGWNKCFLDLRHAGLPYLFGPIGFLLGLNFLLFLATIFSMYKLQESTKFASANNSQVKKQRGKIRLYTKLFLLMGISWIFELISYVIYGADANIFVIIGDMINILQPILIFFIFVCKRDIIRSLCQKYSSLSKFVSTFEVDENVVSTASTSSRGPMLHRFLNPVSTTKWFRARINSTMTDTSNISNLSVRSTMNGIDETPVPSSASPRLSISNQGRSS